MEIYELSQGEQFLIEVIRYFKFLKEKGYDCSGFSIYSREHCVKFKNPKLSREVYIVLEQDLDVIFEIQHFWNKKTISLKEIVASKRPVASVKTLAEIVQSDYMNLISP